MAEMKTTDWWDTYVDEVEFPDTNSAEAVADAAAGLNLYGKGGEDASSPLPRFRNHPDEVDYLMGKGRSDRYEDARSDARLLAEDAASYARAAKKETSVVAFQQTIALANACAFASLALQGAFKREVR